MNKNPQKTKFIELICCNYEKFRIFIKLAFQVPADRKLLTSIKAPLRTLVDRLITEEILFPSDLNEGLLKRLERQLNVSEGRRSAKLPRRLLLVTHELSRTGAPQALLMLAKVFHRHSDFEVFVLTLKDGPMREDFEASGLLVFNMDEVPSAKNQFLAFLDYFEAVYVCSCSWLFLQSLKHMNKPIVWWVHEVFSKPDEVQLINEFIEHVDLVLAGSPLTVDCMKAISTAEKVKLLLYGLDDIKNPETTQENEKVTFALLGTIGPRKGTDIFVSAIKQLPSELRTRAKFVIVGDKESSRSEQFYKSIAQAAAEIDELELHKSMPLERLLDAYNQYDVIVSASRVDPMPIVLTYAFMFSKLCLCSDAVGTAKLISDGEDGLTFLSESVDSLTLKMRSIIVREKDYSKVAVEGRRIFDQYFSTSAFESKVLALHEDLMDQTS
jgi:glycosyltransferase involved in cell wall biosynthesis